MNNIYKKNVRVLVIEPSNQGPTFEKARPNGNLGPAYIVGSLRKHGIEVDYLDAIVGEKGRNLNETFYKKSEMENGNIRYGMNPKEFPEIFSKYDIIITSSIFTVQTRMHFEIAAMAKKVAKENGKQILTVSGGVNARALREHFLSNGFDIIGLGEGERTVVQIIDQFSSNNPDYSKVERIAFRKNGKTIITSAPFRKATKFVDNASTQPAIDAFPLEAYYKIGVPHWGAKTGKVFTGIQTVRGCQDKCTFCHISLEKKEKDLVGDIGFLKTFSHESINENVTQAVNLGVRQLYFVDDSPFYYKKRTEELASILKRDGLTYSASNGANLRFLVKKEKNRYEPDVEFINLLSDFGLREIMLPFETRNTEIMNKYATGKFNPDEMNPIGILKAIKKAGIRAGSGFMIGFPDEPWESIVKTKEFVKELFAEGLDQAGFAIPVPYPGTLDFEREMKNPEVRKNFNENLLEWTDQMHIRGRPLFPTKIPAADLEAAVKDFWLEVNSSEYVDTRSSMNITK
jgi:radical SAM superfamily enzyme YgiQ (UPF0313 family)